MYTHRHRFGEEDGGLSVGEGLEAGYVACELLVHCRLLGGDVAHLEPDLLGHALRLVR